MQDKGREEFLATLPAIPNYYKILGDDNTGLSTDSTKTGDCDAKWLKDNRAK